LGFQFPDTLRQLPGFLPPFLPTLGHIGNPILQALGFDLQILMLLLPALAAATQEPGLDPVRSFVSRRAFFNV